MKTEINNSTTCNLPHELPLGWQLVRLGEVCEKITEIKILDHIIIGDNKYFNFADEVLIEKYNL
ncbi:MAG: hypothetical protein KAW92_02405 [Candidatus Cloacimonetes bacterium]|nr:hypothetical protein [Candidatus Cloacimonadota bacterium]